MAASGYKGVAIFVLVYCSFIIFVYAIYLELFTRKRVPKTLPSAGFGDEFFNWSRASFRQVLVAPDTAEQGYRQYGANQRSYVVPHSSFRPQVMLPQQHVRWLARQPETILNPEVVRLDRQGITFFPLSTDSKTILMAAHKIIAEALNQKLDALQPQIYDGIRHAVDAGLGTNTDEEWRELPLMDTLSAVLDSAVSRVIFGTKLSRDQGFLRVMGLFIIGGGVLTELIGQLPVGLFRPVVGVPFNIFTMAVKKWCAAYYLRPEISRRLHQIDSGDNKDDEAFDFITQCIRSVRKLKFPIRTDEITFVSDMLMFLALAGVVSTRTTTVNTFMDILGPQGVQQDIYSTLRQEAESIFQSEADWASASSLKGMINTDSCVRESARKNPLQTRGLMKQVMPEDGVTLPDGVRIPQGTWLGVPVEAIHRDETIYPDARGFDALRFARMRVEGESNKSLDASEPSDTYMFFSYGRSACPGRWFATRVMKLLIAYVALHYDIKPLPEDAERFSVGDTKFHHSTAKMVVRRRKLH
ncbi:cytochrome P450 [Xylariaceae sp. FL1651]|nr:cytochrome P450 [Xylariaceae sp. FL1651]